MVRNWHPKYPDRFWVRIWMTCGWVWLTGGQWRKDYRWLIESTRKEEEKLFRKYRSSNTFCHLPNSKTTPFFFQLFKSGWNLIYPRTPNDRFLKRAIFWGLHKFNFDNELVIHGLKSVLSCVFGCSLSKGHKLPNLLLITIKSASPMQNSSGH